MTVSLVQLQDVQKAYLVEARKAVSLIPTTPWCCARHQALAELTVESARDTKNSLISGLRDGKISNEQFHKLVQSLVDGLSHLNANMENIQLLMHKDINVLQLGEA